MSSQPRQQKGTPAGGRFAGMSRDEGDVDLDDLPRADSRPGGALIGSRYDPHSDIKDDAKVIRSEVGAYIAGGSHVDPAEWKHSVRISRFAGGQSVDISLTCSKPVYEPGPADAWGNTRRMTPDAARIKADTEAIVASFNRDDSDTQSDHFDVKFYSNVSVRSAKSA